MTTGADFSHHNRITSYDDLIGSIDFAILKAGGCEIKTGDYLSLYVDSAFNKHYLALKNRGIPVGAYFFCGKRFYTAEEGKREAECFLRILKGKSFEYPIVADIEACEPGRQYEVTDAAIAFCKTLEANGAFAMIYSSDISGYVDRLNVKDLSRFALWVARYGKEPQVAKQWQIWQYTSTGTLPGVAGAVDLNRSKYDFASIIPKKRLNIF